MMISSHAIENLEIWEGATFYQEFTWVMGDPELPVDLTGFTAALQARDAYDNEVVVLDLTTENGGLLILSPEAGGQYAISIPPSLTMGLCPDHEKRTLVYDLFLYAASPADDAGLQQKGKIVINPAVTRPEET
jgi:hypothetical protein